ncbi:MAG: T9SS C-terminal target domain-containing protein [Verrucomicrobia bacterium]|nr:T9SS C-terminal target domain-containing protein [Verrucomicrobiota bacterium]
MKNHYRPVLSGLAAACLLSAAPATAEIIQVSNTDIQGTVQWTRSNTYVLNGFVFVENGEELHIQAGTVIKGKDGEGANISALVVARGGKIFAEGTPSQPIIFTAEADDVNDPEDLGLLDRGLWGGVVLLGRARINTAVDASGNAASPKFDVYEGIPGTNPNYLNFFYGGDNDDDSSGIMRYVSIRHGGKVLESNKEINGLSICAVGRGTTLEFIETYAIKDDGFEFFGGSVNTKYLVSAFNDDDAFDTDQGHTGKHQFWFAIQASDIRDKGMELNGEPSGLAVSNAPLARFTVYNATLIGAGAGSGGNGNNVFTIREYASPRIYNSIFTDFAQRGVSIDAKTKSLLDSGSLDLRDNLWWGFTAGNTAANLDLGNAALLFSDADRRNEISNPLLRGISRQANLGLDPRPASGSPALSTQSTPPQDGFFSPAPYKGAFGDWNWAADWSALGAYAVLTGRGAQKPTMTITQPNPPVIVLQTSPGGLGVAIVSVVGLTYQLQSTLSITQPNWVNEGAPVAGTGAQILINAAISNDPSKFYRVLMQ